MKKILFYWVGIIQLEIFFCLPLCRYLCQKNPVKQRKLLMSRPNANHPMKTHLEKDAFKSSAESLRAPFARKADKNNYFLSFFTFSLVCNAMHKCAPKRSTFPFALLNQKGFFASKCVRWIANKLFYLDTLVGTKIAHFNGCFPCLNSQSPAHTYMEYSVVSILWEGVCKPFTKSQTLWAII